MAYTPLESLLLFQALRAGGVDPTSFTRISDELKAIPDVQDDPTYDSTRLSPDALRDLYLGLLKEEVKKDLEGKLSDHEDGTLDGSRKRKAPSPKLPTVHEAAQHAHLIPRLVERLYARYRENAVREIQEEERRFDELSREIADIEAGEWDERFRQELAIRPAQAQRQQSNVSPGYVEPTKADTASPQRYSQAKIDAVINHGPEPPSGHRRTSSGTTLPPLSEMAPDERRFGIPPSVAHAMLPEPVRLAIEARGQLPGPGYHPSPPSAHQTPYHGHPPAGLSGSPQMRDSLTNRPSSSPRPILPPPKNMPLANVQTQHSPSPYPPTPQYPRQPSIDQRQPRNVHLPTPPSYYQQHPQQPYQDVQRRPSHPPPQVQPSQPLSSHYNQPQQPHAHGSAYPTHQGGHMLPPFQVAPQQPVQAQHQMSQPYPGQQHSTPQPSRYPSHQPLPPKSAPARHPDTARVSAMLGTPRAAATPPRLWKTDNRLPRQQSPERPSFEPLSPIKLHARPAQPQSVRSVRGPKAKVDRASPNEGPSPADEQPQPTIEPPPRPQRKTRKTRGPSVASSGPARSTRSHSVSSAVAPTPAAEERPVSRDVKNEPATPAHAASSEPDAETDHKIATARSTRKRRATLQTPAQPSAKRNRRRSPSAAASSREASEPVPPPRSNTVTASRTFPKMAQVILNDITSHKHGSRFAVPVREKDVPGYSEIIKRPQDMKSIRAAVTAGSRALANATATDSPAPAKDAVIELERTVEVLPPKAVMNSAQLEKEVMRMLANAVMFNPGDEDMVADTREMAFDVEARIREWRGAETQVEEVEEESDARGKRRRA